MHETYNMSSAFLKQSAITSILSQLQLTPMDLYAQTYQTYLRNCASNRNTITSKYVCNTCTYVHCNM